MQKLLDREMPVEDRRRRPLWLFWLFGLMLCLTTTYVVWQAWPSETKGQRISESATPVAGLDDQSGPNTKQAAQQRLSNPAPSTPQKVTPSGKTAIQTDRPQKQATRSILQQQQASLQPKTDHLPENLHSEIASPLANRAATATAQAAAPNQITAEKSSENDAVNNTDNAIQPAESNQLAASPETPAGIQPDQTTADSPLLNPLPEMAKHPAVSAATDTVAQANVQPPVEPVKSKLPKPWSFGATVGLLTSSDFNYSGTNLGLSVEWQPARHWGLRGNLLYQFQQLQKEQRSILEVSSGSYVLLTGDQTALDPGGSIVVSNPTQSNSLVTPVYVPVSRLHRLEIPVNAFWQPFKKWRILGGLSMGMNLYAQSGRQTLKNNLVLNVPSGEASRNLNQEITKQLPDWDLRWNVGIGFKPNRHLAFELYMHNPFHLLPQNRNADYLKVSDQGGAFESYGQQVATNRPAIGDQTLFQISASAFF